MSETTFTRRVRDLGGSIGIAIPKPDVDKLRIEVGDLIDVTIRTLQQTGANDKQTVNMGNDAVELPKEKQDEPDQ